MRLIFQDKMKTVTRKKMRNLGRARNQTDRTRVTRRDKTLPRIQKPAPGYKNHKDTS